MSIDEANQKSKMIEQDRMEAEIMKNFLQEHAGYKEALDGFLQREAYDELLDYCKTDDFRALCYMEAEAAIMSVVLAIYEDELKEGSEKIILTDIHSVQEARERYLQAKFVMWRLEFFDECDGFLELLDKNQVSSCFLKYLIHTSSFDKMNTTFKMAMLLKENGRFAQAFAMLNYANELCPDEEIVYCEMAEVCLCAGLIENANNCVQRIKNPSGILAEYWKKWGL